SDGTLAFRPPRCLTHLDTNPSPPAWRRAVIRSLRTSHRAAALAISLAALSVSIQVGAQRPRPPTGPLRPFVQVGGAALPFDTAAFDALRWRELGRFRGGGS